MDWTKIPYTKEIIKKQCEFANYKFEDIDFDSDSWFYDTSWNEDQQESFKNWVIDYLQKNKKARNEVCNIPSIKSKKYLEKWWRSFDLMYGFKRNDV